jgi:hypothetical protein
LRSLKEKGLNTKDVHQLLDKFVYPFIFQLNAKSCQQADDSRKTAQELSELKAALSSIKQKLARAYGKNEHLGHTIEIT